MTIEQIMSIIDKQQKEYLNKALKSKNKEKKDTYSIMYVTVSLLKYKIIDKKILIIETDKATNKALLS